MAVREYDVAIIGGGPAGSSAATLLARQGHRVVLFEREKFPRDHVGESLLPFCHALFDNLGVLGEMEKRYVRKPGVRFLDRNGRGSTTWCFSQVINDATYLSFQVNRADFDTMLLENSRKNGADVREQVRVQEVDLSRPDQVMIDTVDGDGVVEKFAARFLVDASGRDAFVGSKNGWRKPRPELDRTALWSHWDGVTMTGGLEEGLSLICYMGEEKKGWIWIFPLTEDRITAGVVMQNAYIRDQRRKLQAEGSTDWVQDLAMQELRFNALFRSLTEGKRQVLPMLTNGNYSYEVTNHYSTNYAMIGDARGFIDPIFSSGVFLSIKTAHLVSDAVHQLITDGPEAGQPALVGAYELVTGAYDFVHRMIRLFYNPHAVTWAEVSAEGAVHKQHESAMATGHFMLAGDFFENYEKYTKLFELLENPKSFARYAKLVLENRNEPGDQPCGTPHEIAFPRQEPATA